MAYTLFYDCGKQPIWLNLNQPRNIKLHNIKLDDTSATGLSSTQTAFISKEQRKIKAQHFPQGAKITVRRVQSANIGSILTQAVCQSYCLGAQSHPPRKTPTAAFLPWGVPFHWLTESKNLEKTNAATSSVLIPEFVIASGNYLSKHLSNPFKLLVATSKNQRTLWIVEVSEHALLRFIYTK